MKLLKIFVLFLVGTIGLYIGLWEMFVRGLITIMWSINNNDGFLVVIGCFLCFLSIPVLWGFFVLLGYISYWFSRRK